MSVVGFDIGNENCAIAVAKSEQIDVLWNDESKLETPAVVSFGKKQRFFGSVRAGFAATYPKSTISQIKRLIGRQYEDSSLQEELRLLPFDTIKGPRGGVLIRLEYLGETWTFMPVEILGMFFAHLKQLTEKNLEHPVKDCVIGIPSYFTDLQRREYLSAADIGGLRPLQLMPDCTAIALGYGMYKTDFSDEGPTNVIFVDVGHSDTQVTVAAFEKDKTTILSHSFDQHLGGRDFDEVLFRHFAAQFKEEFKIDVYSKTSSCISLRASCEKLKKVLSANVEALLSIDCLIDDIDVNGKITREEFEKLSLELLDRVTDACLKAMEDSGLSGDNIHTIELVGSGSRIPAITRNLTSNFGKEPVRTLNGSECVARGCALRCSMLSSTYRDQDYKIEDIFPYSIELRPVGINRKKEESMQFPKGCPVPGNHKLRYGGNATCYEVLYTNNNDFPAGISPKLGRFEVGPSHTDGEEIVNGSVKVQFNIHGIVEIDAYEKGRWVNRGRSQKLVAFENLVTVMTKDELLDAQDRKKRLAEQDIQVEKTKEKRNTMESFIYDTRSKLLNSYRSMATDSEVEEISKLLQETEEWLYEEGHDESEQVYTGKLEDIKKLLSPIENRYKGENARKEATKDLERCIEKYRSAAGSLPPSQKEEVYSQCLDVENWLMEISHVDEKLAKKATCVSFCSSAISGVTKDLVGRYKDIMRSKPSSGDYYHHDIKVDHQQISL